MGMATNGGIRNLLMLADLAIQLGHEVTFYCPKGKITHNFFIENPNIQFSELGPKLNNKFLSWLMFGLLFPIRNRSELIIVGHFFPYLPSIFALRKKRVIYFVQGIEYKCYKGPVKVIAYLMSLLAFRSKHLYAGNLYLYEELSRLGTPHGYINMGVDTVFLDTPLLGQSANKRPYDIIYYLRGENYKRKDRFERVLPALAKKGYKILCVTPEPGLAKTYSQYNVTVTQPADDRELIQCIDSARILVYTSDYEGFALPPLECMARGVPSVLYDCGGPRNYAVDHHNALILENEDSAPLLDSIEKILNDRVFYEKLAENARRTAEGKSLQPELLKFLEEITADLTPQAKPA